MKIKRIIIFSFFSILVLWSFSTNKSISKDVQDEIQDKDKALSKEVDFASDAIVKFYNNRDLGEKNNLELYFSKDVLKLMNYKIKYNNLKSKELDNYYRYEVTVKPVDVEKWKQDGNIFNFKLQVITKFTYSKSDEISDNSLVLEFTVTKDKEGNLKITRCYQSIHSEVDEAKFYDMLSKNEDVDKWLNENFEKAKKDFEKSKDYLGLDFYRIIAVCD
ncbi:hypothetical protein VJI77_04620 [Parvimonas sp. D2]|uniref:hypothetical protein n=1 Tax=unclassified Parvimonas TaxID=1151464 RepID=UPI002B461652|nr:MULTISPECIES: hypothetical protein [unclassified Parvimonas]MEB3012277.1 hypothetical protein [Parvimonas sp. D2]MEB3087778.1 hypothetical protein [Parvimonas sp. D4]